MVSTSRLIWKKRACTFRRLQKKYRQTGSIVNLHTRVLVVRVGSAVSHWDITLARAYSQLDSWVTRKWFASDMCVPFNLLVVSTVYHHVKLRLHDDSNNGPGRWFIFIRRVWCFILLVSKHHLRRGWGGRVFTLPQMIITSHKLTMPLCSYIMNRKLQARSQFQYAMFWGYIRVHVNKVMCSDGRSRSGQHDWLTSCTRAVL